MSKWEYVHKVNRRAKSTILRIYPDGRIVVTTPRRVSPRVLEKFLTTKSAWIEKTLKTLKSEQEKNSVPVKHSEAEIKRYKNNARKEVTERLLHFNQHYGFRYAKISIRNQRTRWGSCSKSGTLSFNYRIALLTPRLRDYIIVHELCHIREMNHSEQFWKLIAETIPDYKARRSELKKNHLK